MAYAIDIYTKRASPVNRANSVNWANSPHVIGPLDSVVKCVLRISSV